MKGAELLKKGGTDYSFKTKSGFIYVKRIVDILEKEIKYTDALPMFFNDEGPIEGSEKTINKNEIIEVVK